MSLSHKMVYLIIIPSVWVMRTCAPNFCTKTLNLHENVHHSLLAKMKIEMELMTCIAFRSQTSVITREQWKEGQTLLWRCQPVTGLGTWTSWWTLNY